MKDSPKVSYIKNMLSSSSSLKNKEVLSKHGGGVNLREVGQAFENMMAVLVIALEHYNYLCLVLQLGNIIVSKSYQSYESLYSFESFEEFPSHHHTMFGHLSLSQWCQVTSPTIQCSREVRSSIKSFYSITNLFS